jgi:hypothetical protein
MHEFRYADKEAGQKAHFSELREEPGHHYT